MWPRGPTTFTAGFAMPLSKIVSRWTLSTKDYFRSFCMWWALIYSHEDWDIAKRAIEPIKRSLSKTSQYVECLYKTLLCLFAEWTLLNTFVYIITLSKQNLKGKPALRQKTQHVPEMHRSFAVMCVDIVRSLIPKLVLLWHVCIELRTSFWIRQVPCRQSSNAHLPNCRRDNLLFGDLGKF